MENTFAIFNSLSAKEHKWEISFEKLVRCLHTSSELKAITEAYRKAETDEQKKQIKQGAKAFLAASKVKGGRTRKCITKITGIALFDADHINPDEMEAKLELAQRDPHTLLCYTTISGRGIRVLFRYEWDDTMPLETLKRYYGKAYLCGNLYYAKLLGCEYDPACKDPVRLSVMAYDPKAFSNVNSVAFTQAEVATAANVTKKNLKTIGRIETIFKQLCEPKINEAGVSFVAGSHNNYVMRIGYMMNDYGVPVEDAVVWAVGKYGAEYQGTEKTIRDCYAAQPDEFGKSANTMKRLIRRSKDNGMEVFANVDEILDFLSNEVETRWNALKDRIEYRKLSDKDGKFQYLTETAANSLWVKMSKQTKVRISDMYHVLESDFSKPYNPLHEYLNSLSEWSPDQPDYIAGLAQTVTVEGDDEMQQLFGIYLRKWLVGMVAAWLAPEVVNHVVLVFIGKQGVYKSTWFNYLLPRCLKEYYCVKVNSAFLDKDDLILQGQNALVCLEEIDNMTDRTANFFKAAITASNTTVRAAYARYAEQREHVASYCGTGNNPQFINEATARRWLPFLVKEINSPLTHPFNHDGIYAQAKYLFENGFQYWFDAAEIAVLAEHNRDYQAPCLEEELISVCFRKPTPEEFGQFFPTALVLKYIADNLGSKLNSVKVAKAMREMGYIRKIRNGIRGWICIPLSGGEMEDQRKRMAIESDPD